MNAGRLTLKIALRQPSVPGDVKMQLVKKNYFFTWQVSPQIHGTQIIVEANIHRRWKTSEHCLQT